jgi:hypothetical protein
MLYQPNIRIGLISGKGYLRVVALQEFLCAFRQAVADLAGQAVVDFAGVDAGYVGNYYWRWRGYRHDEPDHTKEEAAGEGNQLQDQRVARRVVADCAKRHEKHYGGDAGHDHEANIDGAVRELAGAAVGAFGEVLFVVAAHLWREAGNVVPPAGKNVANYLVTAQVAHGLAQTGLVPAIFSSHPTQSGCNGLS